MLYTDSAGSIWWWQPQLSVSAQDNTKGMNGCVSGGQIRFEHQNIRSTISGGGAEMAVQNNWFNFSVLTRVADFGPLMLRIPKGAPLVDGDAIVTNSGGTTFIYGNTAAVHFAAFPLSLCAGAFLAAGDWGEGDLYYCYGYPVLPVFGIYNASIIWNNMLRFSFLGFRAAPQLYSNGDNFYLGGFDIQCYMGGSELYLRLQNHRLSFAARYIYTGGIGRVSLTAENQLYLFFPYKYLIADGDMRLHIINFDAGWEMYSPHDISHIQLRLGAAVCLHDEESYSASYLEKNNFIFNGNSGSVQGMANLFQGTSLLYGYISYTFRPLSFFSLSVKKLTVVPVLGNGLKKLLAGQSSGGDSVAEGGFTQDMLRQTVKTVLLSGLTVSVSLYF